VNFNHFGYYRFLNQYPIIKTPLDPRGVFHFIQHFTKSGDSILKSGTFKAIPCSFVIAGGASSGDLTQREDDNVHYQNMEYLVNELILQNKQFQMMSYPNRSHGISEGENTSRHLYSLITNYLMENNK
jgi:hypothetical protein